MKINFLKGIRWYVDFAHYGLKHRKNYCDLFGETDNILSIIRKRNHGTSEEFNAEEEKKEILLHLGVSSSIKWFKGEKTFSFFQAKYTY